VGQFEVWIRLPGGSQVGVYQPKHAIGIGPHLNLPRYPMQRVPAPRRHPTRGEWRVLARWQGEALGVCCADAVGDHGPWASALDGEGDVEEELVGVVGGQDLHPDGETVDAPGGD